MEMEEIESAIKLLGRLNLSEVPEGRFKDGIEQGSNPIWHKILEIDGKKYEVDAKLYEGLAIMKMIGGEYFGKTKWFTEIR